MPLLSTLILTNFVVNLILRLLVFLWGFLHHGAWSPKHLKVHWRLHWSSFREHYHRVLSKGKPGRRVVERGRPHQLGFSVNMSCGIVGKLFRSSMMELLLLILPEGGLTCTSTKSVTYFIRITVCISAKYQVHNSRFFRGASLTHIPTHVKKIIQFWIKTYLILQIMGWYSLQKGGL